MWASVLGMPTNIRAAVLRPATAAPASSPEPSQRCGRYKASCDGHHSIPRGFHECEPEVLERMFPPKRIARIAIAKSAGRGFLLLAGLSASAQVGPPEILSFLPASGPEGTRVKISGQNLVAISAVLFGATAAVFAIDSSQTVIAIVPHGPSVRTSWWSRRRGAATAHQRSWLRTIREFRTKSVTKPDT